MARNKFEKYVTALKKTKSYNNCIFIEQSNDHIYIGNAYMILKIDQVEAPELWQALAKKDVLTAYTAKPMEEGKVYSIEKRYGNDYSMEECGMTSYSKYMEQESDNICIAHDTQLVSYAAQQKKGVRFILSEAADQAVSINNEYFEAVSAAMDEGKTITASTAIAPVYMQDTEVRAMILPVRVTGEAEGAAKAIKKGLEA